ncbi:SusD/RagB family nutrient-binding outer membrane lipoprotein [Hyunsoonleella rubra]|uniref:SusD/RagB family nutrient-binding outer membrane lipoprotein n=1 Tax=Hyunsoonleella rubra TaxID=1737062 RepID=A0ABW5TCP8_9FLAO
MKNSSFKKYFKYFLSALILSVTFGCDKYLDVDTDEDNPTVAPLNLLLTDIQYNTIANAGNFNFWSADLISVYTHQFTAREEQDQYGIKADNVNLNNEWENTFLGLNNLQTLISQAADQENLVYLGIGQILKAYLITLTVDLYGDVPFTEATSLTSGVVSPAFDDDEAIYQAAMDLLDQGKTNVNSGTGLLPGADDLIYGGDVNKWTKFVNSLKLKLFNQVRSTSLYSQSAVDALVNEGNFFSSSADDFEFVHTANIAPTDERNQLFQSAYGGAQVTHYISPWFYEILMGMNPNIHTGIVDPRIPYYWVNQLQDGQFPRDQGDTDTGDPNADYWDRSTGFFSIRFGSIGPDRDHAVQTDATFPGIFPCGGRYDDNAGFARTINSGTGVAPKRMLTYDELQYVMAEMMHAGLIAGNAGDQLEQAITDSFAKVDKVVAGTGTTQTVPTLLGTTEATDFIAAIRAEFDAASTEKQLEIIMTQKWTATFGDPIDQYTDYRRTGYPVLADPSANSGEYQLDNGDGWPLDDTLTTLNNQFQTAMFWPQNELDLNQNAPEQKDATSYKIFWDN